MIKPEKKPKPPREMPKLCFLSVIAVMFYIYQVASGLSFGSDDGYIPANEHVNAKCAIATFVDLRSDDVFSAVSLSRSLYNTNTSAYKIAVVYGYKDDSGVRLLKNAGWNIIEPEIHWVMEHDAGTPSIYSPDDDNDRELSEIEYIMARFFVFSLVDFEVIVYVDNDAVVTSNIDELCNCKHATIGSVIQTQPREIGLMTLIPSVTTYDLVQQAVEDGAIIEPHDVFELFYEMERCPYFDPMTEVASVKDKTDCIRLPSRYDGDVVFRIFWSWENSKKDRPKIVHYSLPGMKQWSWWSNIIVPEYWVWAEGYMEVIEKARAYTDPTIALWIIKMASTILILFTLVSFKRCFATNVFGFLYTGYHSSKPPLYKLFAFHVCNLIIIAFAFYWSSSYTMHPFLNLLLFVVTLTGFYDILLFLHVPFYRFYYCSTFFLATLGFFTAFFSTVLIPAAFVYRLGLIVFWFASVNGVFFTYLMVISYSKSLVSIVPSGPGAMSSRLKAPLPTTSLPVSQDKKARCNWGWCTQWLSSKKNSS